MAKKTLNSGQIAIIMVLLTASAKVLGLVRELMLAHFYGAGVVIDAFCMAQDIPDTVFATVIQLVGTAFLPIYSRKIEQEGPLAGNKFTSNVYTFLLSAAAVMIGLCVIFPGAFVKLFAPGFSTEATNLTKFFLRIAVFTILGHVTIAIFEPYLRYNGSYLLPVISGFFQSVLVIFSAYLSFATTPSLLIIGVPAGTILQAVLLIWYSTKNKGYRYTPGIQFRESIKPVFILALPVLFSSLAFRLNTFFDRMLASGFDAGSISALRYGHLIHGLISTFSYSLIGTLVYPKYNKLAAKEDYKGLSELSGQSNNYSSILTIPIALGCMIFSVPVIRLIFERGAFDTAATAVTASVFFWYALSLPFNGMCSLICHVCYSLQDLKMPVFCSFVTVGTNLGLNFLLSYFMGVQGLALATTISAVVHLILLIILFKRKHTNIKLFAPIKYTLLIILGSILSVGSAYGIYQLLGHTTLNFVLAALIAVILYIGFVLIFKIIDPALVKETLNLKGRKKN